MTVNQESWGYKIIMYVIENYKFCILTQGALIIVKVSPISPVPVSHIHKLHQPYRFPVKTWAATWRSNMVQNILNWLCCNHTDTALILQMNIDSNWYEWAILTSQAHLLAWERTQRTAPMECLTQALWTCSSARGLNITCVQFS